jgi:hypothetical protein
MAVLYHCGALPDAYCAAPAGNGREDWYMCVVCACLCVCMYVCVYMCVMFLEGLCACVRVCVCIYV